MHIYFFDGSFFLSFHLRIRMKTIKQEMEELRESKSLEKKINQQDLQTQNYNDHLCSLLW